MLTAERGGSAYVARAMGNARALGCEVRALGTRGQVAAVLGTGGGGDAGESGYVNWGSGWADAGGAMGGCLGMVVREAEGRNGEREAEGEGRGEVVLKRGKARRLLFREVDDGGADEGGKEKRKREVVGAVLEDGDEVRADLTVVAAGAWSGALVDLRGRAEARAQVLAYVRLTNEERERLKDMPVVLNLSSGMFAIPPIEMPAAAASTPATAAAGETIKETDWVLKIARHAFGYANPSTVHPAQCTHPITTSLPHPTSSPIPREGLLACRRFLATTIPWLATRPFAHTRLCWYTDTPSGDFLVDAHPDFSGLFLATGGSGHGFKFLPVLGGKVVEALEGRLGEELRGLWGWRGEAVRPFRGCGDGSRMGERGLLLGEEWGKGEGEGEGGGEVGEVGVRSKL